MPDRLIGGNERGSQVHNVLSQEVLLDVEEAILVYQTPQIPLVQFPPGSGTFWSCSPMSASNSAAEARAFKSKYRELFGANIESLLEQI